MADIELRLGSDVLVVQGAMGTMFEAAGFGGPGETCYPFLNLTEPETVEELHRRYLAAGADCAVTNTFLATSSRLAPYGLLAYAEQINREGVRLARGVGFQHVLAAVGPCGVEVEPGSGLAALAASEAPDGAVYPPEACAPGYGAAVEQYAEQIAALACEGPDAVLLETFTDLDDILAAVDAARRVCDLPVMACLSFVHGPGGRGLEPRSRRGCAGARPCGRGRRGMQLHGRRRRGRGGRSHAVRGRRRDRRPPQRGGARLPARRVADLAGRPRRVRRRRRPARACRRPRGGLVLRFHARVYGGDLRRGRRPAGIRGLMVVL